MSAREMTADRRPTGPLPFLAGLSVLAALFALLMVRVLPREALPADAAGSEFSEGRARAVLTRLLGDESPHPIGSAANAAVRERVVEELRALGLEPSVRPGFACGGIWGSCGPVVNVIARIPGRRSDGAVLLSAHYDSVGAGPGASDAGASVAAVLEIARILTAGESPDRPVLVLINDGEEAGLLGARAFLEEPEAKEVFAAVNLEARGTSGPSALFETGPGNAAFVAAWAKQAKRPVTSSTLYDLYTLLPSDTDLTVYKGQGWPGLNFAFADGHARYHTPRDELAHLDPRTFQHHGDNALAAVRALTAMPDSAANETDSVWLDVASAGVLHWPVVRNWPIFIGLAALTILAVAVATWRHAGLAETAIAPLWVLLALGLSLAAGEGLVRALQLLLEDRAPWTAHPAWATLAVGGGVATAALLVTSLLVQRISTWAWWAGCALVGLALSALLVIALPGAASLGFVPCAALSAGLLFASLAPQRARLPSLLLGLAVAAWPWMAIGYALHVMMGLSPAVALSAPVGLIAVFLGMLLPWDRERWLPAFLALAVATVGFVGAMFVPRYSQELPRHANLVHLENADSGVAWWLAVANPPAELLAALAPADVEVEGYPRPGETGGLSAATAPAASAPPPELELLADEITEGGRRLRLRLRSPRGADIARVSIPAGTGLTGVRVNGRELPPNSGAARRLGFRGLPPDGLEIELAFAGQEPVTLLVEDRLRELPPTAARLLQARPPNCVPIQDGDVSILYRTLRY